MESHIFPLLNTSISSNPSKHISFKDNALPRAATLQVSSGGVAQVWAFGRCERELVCGGLDGIGRWNGRCLDQGQALLGGEDRKGLVVRG